jgi:hypothetical protein
MRALMLHYQFHGLTWTDWEERQRRQNEPIQDIYPNKRAPVAVLQDGEHGRARGRAVGLPEVQAGRQLGDQLPHAEERPVAALARSRASLHRAGDGLRRARQKHASRRHDVAVVQAGRRAAVLLRRIWRPWTGDRGTKKAPNVGDHTLFAIMTTEPNGVVEPVHEQAMPVLLMTAAEVDRWLNGSSVEDALAMQRPAADDALEVGPPVKPEKKAA